MSLLNPRTWFERKESAAGQSIVAFNRGQPVWSDRNYESFSREAYMENAIAFACVRMIADAASAVPIQLMRGDKEVESHDVLGLLARPNPVNAGKHFAMANYSFLMIAGNAYIEATGPEGGAPRELWYLRPDRMKVVPGPDGLPQSYVHEVNGIKTYYPVDLLNGRARVLHLREFHPLNDWYGMGRTEPAAKAIDRHNAASAHNKALLDNGARLSGMMSFQPVKGADGQVKAAPVSMVAEAERRLKDEFTSPGNAGRVMVANGDVKWTPFGLSPVDMDHSNNVLDAAREICHSYGVPITLILPGESTYSNKREAKLEFYEDTVLPLVDLQLTEFNNWLIPNWEDDLELAANLDGVSALEPRREAKRKSTLELVSAGILDSDEARQDLGYGDRPDGAVEKVDASVLKVLVDAMPKVGSEPVLTYLKSVGLYDASMTVEQMAAAALGLEEDDEGDPQAPAEDEAIGLRVVGDGA